jgi:hypothetical protein
MDRQSRAVGIRVPLSAAQRAAIRESTGQDIADVVVVGETTSTARLENEVTAQFDHVMAHVVATANETFQQAVAGDRAAHESRPTQEPGNAPYHLPSLAYTREAVRTAARVTALRVLLTDDQRAKVKSATGSDVTEALIVSETEADTLDQESTSALDLAVARRVWEETAQFRTALSQDPAARQAEDQFTKRTGSASPPHLVLIR